MIKLFRWLLLPFSFATNQIAIALQFMYFIYFMYFIARKVGHKVEVQSFANADLFQLRAKKAWPDRHGIVRPESHCLLQQPGSLLQHPELVEKLLEATMRPSGSLYRRIPDDEEHLGPSQDCLASWLFVYTYFDAKRPDLVKRLAMHYLKECFGLKWEAKGNVSVRSSAGGIAPTADGWPSDKIGFGLSQPINGPTFLSAAALFALAARELGGVWKLIYRLYYALYGGYFFMRVPVMHSKTDLIYYTWHISLLCLYSMHKCGIDTKKPMRYLAVDIAPGGNLQPHLAAIAAAAGALTLEERREAIRVLEAIKGAQDWPQTAFTSEQFLVEGTESTNYTMMYFAYHNLKE